MRFLKKCLKIRTGLKRTNPNERLALSYLEQAEQTLKRVSILIEEDPLWATVRIYYAAYYSLYAFMQKIGVKSENHECSIELVSYLLQNNEIAKKIRLLRDERIDSQYYLKFPDKISLVNNYTMSREIYVYFYNLCSENEKDKLIYIERLNELFS